jgi:putative endonuclease
MRNGCNNRLTGTRYESFAAEYLAERGYTLLEKNYRIRMGEIDLILRAPDQTLVFCEVKYRRSDRCGSPVEAVDRKKQRIISRVASFYLASHGIGQEVRCRFDIIGITSGHQVTHLENAFFARF